MQFSIIDDHIIRSHTDTRKFWAFVLTDREIVRKNLKHANSQWMYAVFTVRRTNDIQNIAIIYEYDMYAHSSHRTLACIEENPHIKYEASSD
jgi:hypothetical protein